jgi:hypothetical protein
MGRHVELLTWPRRFDNEIGHTAYRGEVAREIVSESPATRNAVVTQKLARSSDKPALSIREDVIASGFSGTAGLIAACILMSASAAKLFEIYWDCPPRLLLHRPEALAHLLHIQWEAFLATWLIAARRAFAPLIVAMFWFCILASVSAINVLSGVAACDCFGLLKFPPVLVAGVDLFVVILLAAGTTPLCATRAALLGSLKSTGWPLCMFLTVGCAAALGLRHAQARTDASIRVQGNGEAATVVLRVEDWIGRRCPLLDLLDPPADISRGRWSLLLVHTDCIACRNAIRAAATRRNEGNLENVCIVALPGSAMHQSTLFFNFPVAFLRDSRRWYVGSPALVVLEDGVVRAATANVVL